MEKKTHIWIQPEQKMIFLYHNTDECENKKVFKKKHTQKTANRTECARGESGAKCIEISYLMHSTENKTAMVYFLMIKRKKKETQYTIIVQYCKLKEKYIFTL